MEKPTKVEVVGAAKGQRYRHAPTGNIGTLEQKHDGLSWCWRVLRDDGIREGWDIEGSPQYFELLPPLPEEAAGMTVAETNVSCYFLAHRIRDGHYVHCGALTCHAVGAQAPLAAVPPKAPEPVTYACRLGAGCHHCTPPKRVPFYPEVDDFDLLPDAR
jgi:hypothetical protein